MSTQPLPGFRDFYPADFAFRAHIFERWREVARRYGFEEYDGPPLEPLELYTAKSGDEIVGQLYNFKDKGDRDISLRPEMTPTVARMVAARAGGMKKPIRWFSIAQFFRYERQQRGRLREFYQLNCDIFGETGELADAELVALAVDMMRSFALKDTDFRVRISDRRLLNAVLTQLGIGEPQWSSAYAVLDKMGRKGVDPMALLKEHGLDAVELVQLGSLSRETVAQRFPEAWKGSPLAKTLAALDQMGLSGYVDLDLTIVRGLAYYTGTVFEIFDAGRSLRAIAGGGRYDGLLNLLGGVDLPAVGFAIGDVVLGELLKDRGLAPPVPASIDAFVAGVTEADLPFVLKTAHRLREAGVRVEYSLKAENLGKQLKLADAREAAFAVVIGPDDRAKGEVQLKSLRQKTQQSVKQQDLVTTVRNQLTANG